MTPSFVTDSGKKMYGWQLFGSCQRFNGGENYGPEPMVYVVYDGSMVALSYVVVQTIRSVKFFVNDSPFWKTVS